jgi:hypothetical protein
VLQEGLHHAQHGLRLVAVHDEEHSGKLQSTAKRLDLVTLDQKHHDVLKKYSDKVQVLKIELHRESCSFDIQSHCSF